MAPLILIPSRRSNNGSRRAKHQTASWRFISREERMTPSRTGRGRSARILKWQSTEAPAAPTTLPTLFARRSRCWAEGQRVPKEQRRRPFVPQGKQEARARGKKCATMLRDAFESFELCIPKPLEPVLLTDSV